MFKINVEQFAILANALPDDNFDIDTSLGFRYAPEQRKIAAVTEFSFIDENELKFLVLNISCEFEIAPDDWNKLEKDGQIVVPKAFLEYLAVQTVGTARGILHCKTEGTPFNQIIIPPINIAAMHISDLAFPASKRVKNR